MGKTKKTEGSLGLIDECITDAKALMEISLFNAQEKLKERFTPQLKSLIAKRLQQEEDDLEDDDLEDVEAIDDIEDVEDEEDFDDIEDEEEIEVDAEDFDAPAEEDEIDVVDDEDLEDDEEIDLEGIEDDEFEDDEDEAVDDLEDAEMDIDVDDLENDEDEDEEINLEAIMKQMEELSEDDDLDIEDDEIDIEDDEDDDEELEFDIEDDEVDEDIDIEEDVVDEEVNKLKETNTQLALELEKYKAGAKLFKEKIAEQKFVQAKLLYVNDMLKRKKLSEIQKYKIVEAFDKAKNISDIKLIYKTLFEAYKDRQKQIKETKPNALKEGVASKAILVDKKKTIIENKNTSPMKDRYQILANIKK